MVITAVSLTKLYNYRPALDHLDLEVKDGEFMCLLGRNGAGKSTFLKILTMQIRPTSGTAMVNGLDIAKQPQEIKRLLGYVPDTPILYDKLNADEFLVFVGDLYSMDKKEALSRADTLLRILSLYEKSAYLTESYSFGMKKKLAFAAALLHKPKVLIMDEPFDGMDPESCYLVKEILRQFVQHGGTALLTTHVLEIAEALADRVAILETGRLVALGTIPELQENMGAATLEEAFISSSEGVSWKESQQTLKNAVDTSGLF